MRVLVRLARALPARLDLEWLRWARKEMGPLHPELPEVVRRIAHLEDQLYA